MLREIIEKLAQIKSGPCVSIGLNTHRTHPANVRDFISLKNAFQQARIELAEAYKKEEISDILQNMDMLEKKIDHQKNLESLHVFLANDLVEVMRSIWPIGEDYVFVGNEFALNALVQCFAETETYFILPVSQEGTKIFKAENDQMLEEIKNEDFPFEENPFYTTHGDKESDSKLVDKLLLEYLNRIDKAVQKLYKTEKLQTVVLATRDMYAKLMQVTDNPLAYYAHTSIDYNHLQKDDMVQKAWKLVLDEKSERLKTLMEDIEKAVPKGQVYTELNDIAMAAREGRAEYLVIEKGFRFKDQFQDEVLQNRINNRIAWDVIAHNGKVVYAEPDQMLDYGSLVLKARY